MVCFSSSNASSCRLIAASCCDLICSAPSRKSSISCRKRAFSSSCLPSAILVCSSWMSLSEFTMFWYSLILASAWSKPAWMDPSSSSRWWVVSCSFSNSSCTFALSSRSVPSWFSYSSCILALSSLSAIKFSSCSCRSALSLLSNASLSSLSFRSCSSCFWIRSSCWSWKRCSHSLILLSSCKTSSEWDFSLALSNSSCSLCICSASCLCRSHSSRASSKSSSSLLIDPSSSCCLVSCACSSSLMRSSYSP